MNNMTAAARERVASVVPPVRAADDSLDQEERAVATWEHDLATREAVFQQRVDELSRARQQMEKEFTELATAGSRGAERALYELPRMAPRPAMGPAAEATHARQVALQTRKAAADRREKSLLLLDAALADTKQGLGRAESAAERLREEAREARKQATAVRLAREEQKRVEADRARLRELARRKSHLEATGNDRRREDRTRVSCEVSLESESNFFGGFAWDLSTGGLFVASFDQIPVGTSVDITLTLLGGNVVEARGVVRWVRDLDGSNPTALPGVGLQFVDLAPEALESIRSFLKARDPMFLDLAA
jgi:uncharacterized protein (TIGR02266 family)